MLSGHPEHFSAVMSVEIVGMRTLREGATTQGIAF